MFIFLVYIILKIHFLVCKPIIYIIYFFRRKTGCTLNWWRKWVSIMPELGRILQYHAGSALRYAHGRPDREKRFYFTKNSITYYCGLLVWIYERMLSHKSRRTTLTKGKTSRRHARHTAVSFSLLFSRELHILRILN